MRITDYKQFKKFIEGLNYRPTLLLLACCAPCSSHCIDVLRKYFDITVFYSNDNIYPEEEYFTRLDEIHRFTSEFDSNVKVIDDGYNPEDFYKAVEGLESLGEKSPRCYKCYTERLRKTAIKAKELGLEYFSTTLSISPYKVSKWLNEIGFQLEDEFEVSYLYSDFKKENGYKKSEEFSDKYNLYRQDYCGCKFSIEERDRTRENKI